MIIYNMGSGKEDLTVQIPGLEKVLPWDVYPIIMNLRFEEIDQAC